jgi:hypothetical protein
MAKSKKMNLGKTKKSKTIIKRNLKSGLKEDLGYMKEGAKLLLMLLFLEAKKILHGYLRVVQQLVL